MIKFTLVRLFQAILTLLAASFYAIEGYPPSIYDKPLGCPFAPRDPVVMPHCQTDYPPEVEVAPGHTTSRWRHV